MSADAHAELREDVAAYALGALEGSEARDVEAHLAACAGCQGYLHELWPAVDALAASVPQVEPPPELRERLVATVRAEAERIADAEAAEPMRAGRAEGLDWRGLLWRPATALVAAVLVIAGAAVGYAMRGGASPSRSVVPVRPMPGAPAGSVEASLMAVDGQGMLRVRHVPPVGRDHVYEVWVERGGSMRARSTFVPRRDGTATAAVPGISEASAVLVTEEPRGGSAHPTSPPLMRASLG